MEARGPAGAHDQKPTVLRRAQAGRDMAELELTALTGPDSLEPEWVETYREAGVSILYMTPVGREKDAILSEMRTFAQQVGATV